jgi:hypothetical protein
MSSKGRAETLLADYRSRALAVRAASDALEAAKSDLEHSSKSVVGGSTETQLADRDIAHGVERCDELALELCLKVHEQLDSFEEVERALRLLTNPAQKAVLSLIYIAGVPLKDVGEQMLKSRRWGYYKHDEALAVLDVKLEPIIL